jgi:hypothetical protein
MNVMEDAALVSDVATTGDRGYRIRLGGLDLSGSLTETTDAIKAGSS